MKKTRFTEAQIVFALKQAEIGVAIAEICRKMVYLQSWNNPGICRGNEYLSQKYNFMTQKD